MLVFAVTFFECGRCHVLDFTVFGARCGRLLQARVFFGVERSLVCQGGSVHGFWYNVVLSHGQSLRRFVQCAIEWWEQGFVAICFRCVEEDGVSVSVLCS